MAFYSNGKGGFLGGGTAALDLTNGGTIGGNVTLNGNLSMGSGNQILADYGSLAAPGYAFNGEANTGLYRLAGSMSFGRAGVQRGAIDANGVEAVTALHTSAGLRADGEGAAKTANYPITASDVVVLMNGAGLTATLPATPGTGQFIFIKNLDAGNLTVARNGNLINGAAADLTVGGSGAVILHYHVTPGWTVVSAS